ncbi:low-density lipoprotein receptor-related protein 6 [Aricia agestis]|uniref:low-density lipoprotein receptor-related protein 6 n=1 Tax=Aricia agestis TaxID=91739 RepID=UPI001C20AD94|nr:low-density lipoprotein receptor-related protein 6 [Aricia agestis]
MTKRRRIIQADKIIRNVLHAFCLLMFLQLKGHNANNPVLLYSTTYDIRLANTSKLPRIDTVIKGLEQGSAVEFLYRKKLICWSDQNAELIQCAKYNETQTDKMKIVSEGIITPTGMAIDWYTGNIYWTDSETNRIEVISIDKKCRRVLFWTEVDLARAIAVVPKDGLMFWTDWGEVPKIERAGMNADPATRKVIVNKNIMWPNGITVDYKNNLIYWVDAKLHFVDVMDFNGNNRNRVIREGLVYPYALTFFDEKLYWTDWNTLYIYTWDIMTNGPIKELINGSKTDIPVDIKVFDEQRQTPVTDHPCNNNKCSHLCLLSPNEPGYVCSCPTGVRLKEDNMTCYNGFQKFLIVAQRSVILKISLDSPDYTPFTVPVKDLKNALTVDFDPKTEFIYWADRLSKTISRARLDGAEQSVVVHVTGTPDSIAIDPYARNIYWTDPVEDTITMARLDGSYKKIIIHEELYEPRAIALHPEAGWMFWSDWNQKYPKIERANLDGTNRTLLISEKVIWPNGIALDTVNNKLYWCDARTHKIEVCNMDGTERRELHNTDILRIFGLTLLGQHLYWTDTQRRTLDRIDKDTGLDRVCMVEQMANMMGMKAVQLGADSGSSRCSDNNGGCSHICFNRPDDYVCSCPLGLELDNTRKNCIEPEAFLIYSRKNVIGRISIENEHNDAVLPIKEIKEVSALAVHVSGSKIYWSDTKLKTIYRCSIDGSNIEKILEGLGQVEGLAIDWSAQNIYWTDTATQRIEVARLDGSSRRALIWQGLKKPKSIVLDPRRGYMYWSELGSKSIKRASMDGSGVTTLLEQVGRAHALAIDAERRTLYWAALDPPALERAHTDGTGRVPLTNDVTMPYALTVYADRLFWGDWNTGLIESVNKVDGSDRRRVHGALDYIGVLVAWHRARSPPNQCGVDNGGCEHLCLPTPGDFRCACPAHARLRPDNLTCADPEEFLLYATKNTVGRVMVANGECNDATVPVTGLKNIRTIEYDPINKHLYWMDEDSHSIKRVSITYSSTSTSDSTVVVSELTRPYHMVLDVIGRTLYWTCWDSDSINATSIDGNSTGVIMQGDNMIPRLLAFHQTKRILFWSDVGLGAIMRADVNGGRTELARAVNVTALAADTTTLYWAVGRQILAVDFDGTNRRIVWQGGVTSTLAAYGGALYLCGGERSLMRLPLHRRDAPAAPVPHVARITAAVAVRKVARDHPCYGRTCGAGACGVGGACGCGVTCTRDACPRRHFRCEPSKQCVPMEWKCDGQADCPDGSDESSCDACSAGLRCADGKCAAALGGCDAGAPCETALPDAFRCDERLCLAPRLLCDGKRHCEDGSDEAPAACGYAQKDHNAIPTGKQWTALGVCAAVGGACAVAAAGWTVLRRRRRAPPLRALPLVKPLAVRVPPSLHSSDATGSASASDSLCGRYPRPTVNPPPSPATASGGRRRRPPRAVTRPPPPTPASTDHADSETERAPAPPPSPAPLLY